MGPQQTAGASSTVGDDGNIAVPHDIGDRQSQLSAWCAVRTWQMGSKKRRLGASVKNVEFFSSRQSLMQFFHREVCDSLLYLQSFAVGFSAQTPTVDCLISSRFPTA